MTEKEVQEWLIDWFATQSSVPRDVAEAKTDTDYLKKEWIDSMQFIELVSEIEEEFHVEFSNDEFQDRSFSTIEGLSTIVVDKKAMKEQ